MSESCDCVLSSTKIEVASSAQTKDNGSLERRDTRLYFACLYQFLSFSLHFYSQQRSLFHRFTRIQVANPPLCRLFKSETTIVGYYFKKPILNELTHNAHLPHFTIQRQLPSRKLGVGPLALFGTQESYGYL